MNVIKTEIPGVLIIEPKIYGDSRGFFFECWHQNRYKDIGIDLNFVQDNHSRSQKGTLRGLHFQIAHPQGKLIRVSQGEVFDVSVDIRRGSPTFGKWVGVYLSDTNNRQVWIPPGLAHGFCVLSEFADFQYKCTDYYYPGDEGTLVWNDPDIGIKWPINPTTLSAKDSNALLLKNIPLENFCEYRANQCE
jgi:dTDP-4-dehydrorhamnose 3,5-epimerase